MPKNSKTAQQKSKKTKKKSRRPNGAGSTTVPTVGLGAQAPTTVRQVAYRFGSAPVNEDFPEGGLRVTGEMPYGVTLQTTGTEVGLMGPTAGYYTACVCPSSVAVVTTTNVNNGLVSSAYVTSLMANGFSAYRYREFGFEYTPVFTPGDTTASKECLIQASWHSDSGTAAYWAAGITSPDTFITNRSVRWPAWQPMRQTLFREGKSGKDDRLFLMPGNGDVVNVTVTTGNMAWIRSAVQAMVSFVANAPGAASNVLLGRVKWFFTVDLYGMNVGGPVALPSESKGDAKSVHVGLSVSEALARRLRVPPASRGEDDEPELLDFPAVRASGRDERPVLTEPRQERKVARS